MRNGSFQVNRFFVFIFSFPIAREKRRGIWGRHADCLLDNPFSSKILSSYFISLEQNKKEPSPNKTKTKPTNQTNKIKTVGGTCQLLKLLRRKKTSRSNQVGVSSMGKIIFYFQDSLLPEALCLGLRHPLSTFACLLTSSFFLPYLGSHADNTSSKYHLEYKILQSSFCFLGFQNFPNSLLP